MASGDQEVWASNIAGLISVLKYDRRGDVVHELVHPGQRFSLSVEERLLNQDRAAEPGLDVFMNGMLTPLRIVEDSENAKEIANNPNVLAETEMRDLFKLHWKQFEARVGAISNAVTLTRLLKIANEDDTHATVKQVAVLNARKDEVSPPAFVEVSGAGSGATLNTGERKPGAVTPK